jgi:DNA-binding CsgD family transcriptional regulator
MQTQGPPPSRQAWQLTWPFIGRQDELAWVAARRREGTCCGVVVSGAAGVGKTRLARELLAVAVADGVATEWVQATRAAASIPLGAFASLIPPGAPGGNRLQLFQSCTEAIRQRGAGAGGVMLGVDDAQLLDPASAALVLHMATTAAFVVVTVRAGEPCPDSIVALWKDAEALRLELQQLSEDETSALLEAALGADVEPAVLRWVFDSSEGNALYLRELVTGAIASGALARSAGRWQLRSRPRASPALVDLVSARLEGLSSDELEIARLLALGEPLRLEVMTRTGTSAALSRLEARGLAVVSAPPSPGLNGAARLSHPLFAEVVRERTPFLETARLLVRLAEAVRASGMSPPGEALRVLSWLDEAGAPVDAALLLAAARQANTAGEPDLAERLASRAGPVEGVEAALIVAHAHALRRRFAEAEDLLAGLEGQLDGVEPAAEYLSHRALLVLHLGLRRRDDALALLSRARVWFEDTGWVEQVETIELQVRATDDGAPPAAMIEAAERVLDRDDLLAEVRLRVSSAYAFILHHGGRSGQAYAFSQALRPVLPLRSDEDVFALIAWGLIRLEAGYDWDQVEAWLSEAARATARVDDPLTQGQVISCLGYVALRRGQPVTAGRRFREALASLMRRDPLRRLPVLWLSLVMSEAMRGNPGAAREADEQYRALVAVAPVPYLAPQEARAQAALAVAEGRTSHAADVLLQAAAAHQELPIDQGHLLYEALRSHAAPTMVAPHLEAVASSCDAPLIAACARHAGALVAGDGGGLLDAARALGAIGAWLWAAEAAAHAAVAYTQTGRNDSARRALALSGQYQVDCEDIHSPILTAVGLAPAELTRREREIVELAGRGATNAEIAEQLVLSVRTVESHLYRAMAKVGVDDRHDLSSL